MAAWEPPLLVEMITRDIGPEEATA